MATTPVTAINPKPHAHGLATASPQTVLAALTLVSFLKAMGTRRAIHHFGYQGSANRPGSDKGQAGPVGGAPVVALAGAARPARATAKAEEGFMLSTMLVGIRMVVPRSLVVS